MTGMTGGFDQRQRRHTGWCKMLERRIRGICHGEGPRKNSELSQSRSDLRSVVLTSELPPRPHHYSETGVDSG